MVGYRYAKLRIPNKKNEQILYWPPQHVHKSRLCAVQRVSWSAKPLPIEHNNTNISEQNLFWKSSALWVYLAKPTLQKAQFVGFRAFVGFMFLERALRDTLRTK